MSGTESSESLSYLEKLTVAAKTLEGLLEALKRYGVELPEPRPHTEVIDAIAGLIVASPALSEIVTECQGNGFVLRCGLALKEDTSIVFVDLMPRSSSRINPDKASLVFEPRSGWKKTLRARRVPGVGHWIDAFGAGGLNGEISSPVSESIAMTSLGDIAQRVAPKK